MLIWTFQIAWLFAGATRLEHELKPPYEKTYSGRTRLALFSKPSPEGSGVIKAAIRARVEYTIVKVE